MKCIHGGKTDFYKLHSSRLFIKCNKVSITFTAHSNDGGASNMQSKEMYESGDHIFLFRSQVLRLINETRCPYCYGIGYRVYVVGCCLFISVRFNGR